MKNPTTTKLEAVIGLEIHVQLKTASKMFCSCRNGADTDRPNTAVCPTCFGMVGSLPRINKKAIEHVVRTGVALGGVIPARSTWDRKNYFYPDLPKGFQISQADTPLCGGGGVSFVGSDGARKTVRLNHIHLEEDAAKLVHEGGRSMVDFNRAGVPLMEIVTEPDLRSVEEAELFLRELRRIVRYLGVSDADLEKGHLRCDASISLRPAGEEELHPRTEIKNLNSFKMVARALAYEIARQEKLWHAGTAPDDATTVLWDDVAGKTLFMRGKEGAADYRYTPEPDIVDVTTDAAEVARVRETLPELSAVRIERYISHGLSTPLAHTVAEDITHADFLDAVIDAAARDTAERALAVKCFVGLYPALTISVADFLRIVHAIHEKRLSSLRAKDVWEKIKAGDVSVLDTLDVADSAAEAIDLDAVIDAVLAANEKSVAAYRSGKPEALNVLIGKTIAAANRSVPVGVIREELEKKLESAT